MSVFLIATGTAFLILCLMLVVANAYAEPWEGQMRPDWKTLTVSSVVGLIVYGVSLLF